MPLVCVLIACSKQGLVFVLNRDRISNPRRQMGLLPIYQTFYSTVRELDNGASFQMENREIDV